MTGTLSPNGELDRSLENSPIGNTRRLKSSKTMTKLSQREIF